jgi:hypothetical protein
MDDHVSCMNIVRAVPRGVRKTAFPKGQIQTMHPVAKCKSMVLPSFKRVFLALQ